MLSAIRTAHNSLIVCARCIFLLTLLAGCSPQQPPAKELVSRSQGTLVWFKYGELPSGRLHIQPLTVDIPASNTHGPIPVKNRTSVKHSYATIMHRELRAHLAPLANAEFVIMAAVTDQLRNQEIKELRDRLVPGVQEKDALKLVIAVRNAKTGELVAAGGSVAQSHLLTASLHGHDPALLARHVFEPLAKNIKRRVIRVNRIREHH